MMPPTVPGLTHRQSRGSRTVASVTTTPEMLCINNTGGSCVFEDCASDYGPTDCSLGHCVCKPGTCSGGDGVCRKTTNRLISSAFTLRNVRWPAYFIKVSGGCAYVIKNAEDKFTLFELPGASGFLMAPVNQSSSAVALAKDDLTLRNFLVRHMPLALGYSATTLGIQLVAAPKVKNLPKGAQAIMIRSAQHPEQYFGLSSLHWQVVALESGAGAGSFWIPDPPLNLSLPKYDGPDCWQNCGDYDSGNNIHELLIQAVMMFACVLAFAFLPLLSWVVTKLCYSKI